MSFSLRRPLILVALLSACLAAPSVLSAQGLTGQIGGSRWTREAALVKLDTPAGSPSRYRVDAPATLPCPAAPCSTPDSTACARPPR